MFSTVLECSICSNVTVMHCGQLTPGWDQREITVALRKLNCTTYSDIGACLHVWSYTNYHHKKIGIISLSNFIVRKMRSCSNTRPPTHDSTRDQLLRWCVFALRFLLRKNLPSVLCFGVSDLRRLQKVAVPGFRSGA